MEEYNKNSKSGIKILKEGKKREWDYLHMENMIRILNRFKRPADSETHHSNHYSALYHGYEPYRTDLERDSQTWLPK